MDTVRPDNATGFILPPARELLRSSIQDKMVVDEPYKGTHQDLPSIQQEDFVRHRMSDMSVHNKTLSPLDYTQRRVSITDMSNLPLPNSTINQRVISTEEFPSRSSPPFTFPSKRNYDDYQAPPPMSSHPLYDPYQRRHSIAVTATVDHSRNHIKYRGFHFPATIQESPNFGTYSAPPSPPSNVVGHQEMMMHNNHRRQSIPSMNQLLVRRASMPASCVVKSRRGSVVSGSSDLEDHRKESPYSRSPELRVSHKLAERKRRKEMKELFDELRDSLPVEKNMKTSKWEILSKAVEYISLLKRRDYDLESQVSGLRREIELIKRERAPR
ncbi:hypothetical protein BD770DRAFT_376563 [Pilaira anomala]|nr:hypothetical protein BD770DRAFT_376563 [Pilaira anomala]